MTRRPSPQAFPVCLTVAGSDSGGGAGIQADLKSMEAAGTFATSAVTAVTAQNTQGVSSSHVLPLAEIEAQLTAVRSDFDVAAAKTGMLATADVIDLVTEELADARFPLVVDPVMVAATGDRLLNPDAESAYEPLIAAASVVTPNADEAAILTGMDVTDVDDAVRAGEALVEMGAAATLVKGGHLAGETVTDVLVRGDEVERFEHPRVDTRATHGSGCMLASTIAARLAHGDGLETAVSTALGVMVRAVRYPLDVGEGPGSVHHLAGVRNEAAASSTIAAVRCIVDDLVRQDVTRLVPEVGMNVVGATPYAETAAETAAVEGRITRTPSGVRPNAGVALGASSHVARFLLSVREHDPHLRFCLNCRLDDEIEAALQDLAWPIASYDRADEPAAVRATEGSTMAWGAHQAFAGVDQTPAAVLDHGAHGKEPIVTLLAADAETLRDRVRDLHDGLAA